MKKIIILLIGISFCNFFLEKLEQDYLNITVLKKTSDKLYDYYQFDSTYNSKTNTIELKIAYSEIEKNFVLKPGKTYEIEVFNWNPSKILVGDAVFNTRSSCTVDFGKRLIKYCKHKNGHKKRKSRDNCVNIYADYFEIIEIK